MSEASAQPARKKNRGKKWTLIVGALVVLAGAAGAAAQFLGVGERGVAGGTAQAAVQKKADPIFVALDQFTVNLADEGGERFAQLAITLEVADEKTDKAIRARMPSIRNSVLLLLSSKKTAELLTLEGKKQLASEIAARTGAALGWQAPARASDAADAPDAPAALPNPVAAVHFSHFIVQ